MKSVSNMTWSVLTVATIATAFATPNARAAVVSYAGLPVYDVNQQTRWRDNTVTKSTDIDGDNVFGSAGYVMFGTQATTTGYTQNFAGPLSVPGTLSSLPTGSTFTAGWLTPSATITDGWYPQIQDPSNPSTLLSLGMGGRNEPNAFPAGSGQQWVFTPGATTPGVGDPNAVLRLTFFVWNPVNQWFGSGPSNIRLISGTSDTTNITNQSGDWGRVLMNFDVTNYAAGEAVEIWLGSNRPGNIAGQGAFLQGVAFDFAVVPEPTVLTFLAAAAVIGLRRRNARN